MEKTSLVQTVSCGVGQAIPDKEPDIVRSMNRLDAATLLTRELVDTFIQKVNGVLREDPPTVKGDEKQAGNPISTTPLARAIQMQTDRLVGICATLRGVIDQVEL